MSYFNRLTDNDVETLTDRLGIEATPKELQTTTDRIEKLGSIYEELEDIPVEGLNNKTQKVEQYKEGPSRPGPDDDPYNAWLTRFELSQPNNNGKLSDLSVAIKDNTCVRGVELTCGSKAFSGIVPDDHALVVDRLLEAGAKLVGKTNLDELAFGPTSETSAFGPTENPSAEGHVTGGSSSGSAAAVAAGDVDLALGTDTGGSVRIPASYCGIVGMKPTYGRVPLHGVVPLAYSMDHIGTLASSVKMAARGLEVISDPKPAGMQPIDPDLLGSDLESLTIGVVPGFFEKHTSDIVEESVRNAINELADAGADVREIDIPALKYSRQAWWGIAPSEFAAEFIHNAAGIWRTGRSTPSLATGLARVRYASSNDLGKNIKEMLSLGMYLNTELDCRYYTRARNLRTALSNDFRAALSDVDVLAAPGTPTRALEIGGFERGVTPPVNWVTHPTNLTGHPSVVLPCDEVDGLPVGFQLIGSMGEDQTVLDIAYEYENLTK
jgi:Asp-tRNA(Asn)/Glu-tRNA(Gln) amidotransferase A subunit family amidase